MKFATLPITKGRAKSFAVSPTTTPKMKLAGHLDQYFASNKNTVIGATSVATRGFATQNHRSTVTRCCGGRAKAPEEPGLLLSG